MTELLLAEEGPVLRATMNRPERLNALSPGLIEALRELFVGLYWRRDIRVVLERDPAARSALE
ncbi:MAG: hypothetical protein ACK4MT_10230, partial [Thermaurantiacus tibetensis]